MSSLVASWAKIPVNDHTFCSAGLQSQQLWAPTSTGKTRHHRDMMSTVRKGIPLVHSELRLPRGENCLSNLVTVRVWEPMASW